MSSKKGGWRGGRSFSRFSRTAGFTLIELMIVVSVVVILSLVTVNLLLSTLKGTTKDKTMQSVKLSGDYVLVQFENRVRAAKGLVDNGSGEICSPSMGALGLKDENGEEVVVQLYNQRILWGGDFLTTGDVVVKNLSFDCQTGPTGSPAYVEIEFTMNKGTVGVDRGEEVYGETFRSGVSLRQF